MINIKELKINLAKSIKDLTNQNVIWSNQNANTPDGDFILLKISSIRIIGALETQSAPVLIDNQYFIKTFGDVEIVLSVQCISENSFDILLYFLNKLRLNLTSEIFDEKKIVFVGQEGDIIDITTTINGSFENRASVDLLFRISKNYSSEDKYSVGIVEKIGIDASLDGNAKNTPIEFDITIEQN